MRIPVPLTALHAFEAAARHMSIKEAANELAVTPSAISHRLRTLEQALGIELMRRTGTRIELTDAGRKLAPELSKGFSLIAEVVSDLRETRRDGPLRLNMFPSFATHWLSPRLGSYPLERRGCSLEISTTQDEVDLAAGVADAGIWFGDGQWPGLVSELLFKATIDLYAPPGTYQGTLTERKTKLREANLFISKHCVNWREWMNTLPGGPFEPATVINVDSGGLTMQAAADGAGVCIVVCELVEGFLRQQRLESVFNHPVDAGAGFWLVYPESFAEDRRLGNLRAWLNNQLSSHGSPAAQPKSSPS